MSLDADALRTSFELVVGRNPDLTLRFYDHLFALHPEARPLFHRSPREAQAKMLAEALAAVLDHLDDAAWLGATLHAMGAKHVGYGVTAPMYGWVGEALLKTLADGVTALLIETRAPSAFELDARVASVLEELQPYPLVETATFTTQALEIERLWQVRKGTFPAVGAVRKPGTTVIIEDVAVAVPMLAACCLDLQKLFIRLTND